MADKIKSAKAPTLRWGRGVALDDVSVTIDPDESVVVAAATSTA
jgi:hypothetical protein